MGRTAFQKASLSGADQDAETPKAFMHILRRAFGVRAFHDPCPSNPKTNGLVSPWKSANYVNPPYANAKDWVRKALRETRERKAFSVLLIPARTHTRYFESMVFPNATSIVFLTTPLAFHGYKRPFPSPLMLVVFGHPPKTMVFPKSICIPCAHVSLPHGARVDNDVLPMLRKRYRGGRCFHKEHPNATQRPLNLSTRTNMVCIMDRASDLLGDLVRFHEDHPEAMSVVVVMAAFQSHYLRKALSKVHHIVFIGSSIDLTGSGRGSYIGSVVLGLGAHAHFQSDRKCVFA